MEKCYWRWSKSYFFSPCCFSLFLFWNCLHWLPVSLRINYNVLIITYKALHNLGPVYFSDLLQPYAPARSLRSSSVGLLVTPTFRLVNMGTRSFNVAAPRLWNALPQDIHQASSLLSFKNLLKTHFFSLKITLQLSVCKLSLVMDMFFLNPLFLYL